MTTTEMGLFEVMFNCRAMRRLSSEVVPEEKLRRLVEAAGQAASGSNQQRSRWIVVRDAEQKRKIADLNREASEAFVQARIDRSESLPHHDAATRRRMLNAVMWLCHHMHEISTLIVPCYEFDAPPSLEDRLNAQSSIWPGVQNLLLAARAQQLGAVLTTYALSDYDKFADALDLPPQVYAFAVVPVGYPLGKFGSVTRKPVEEVMHFDRWPAS